MEASAVGVFYPREGTEFDHGYYLGPHAELASRLLGTWLKAVSTWAYPEDDKYHRGTVLFLKEGVDPQAFLNSSELAEVVGDVPNFYKGGTPVVQVMSGAVSVHLA